MISANHNRDMMLMLEEDIESFAKVNSEENQLDILQVEDNQKNST